MRFSAVWTGSCHTDEKPLAYGIYFASHCSIYVLPYGLYTTVRKMRFTGGVFLF